MLAVEGETVTVTALPDGGGFWLEEEEAGELPQAARSGARRRKAKDGNIVEQEGIARIVWRAGWDCDNWTKEQDEGH